MAWLANQAGVLTKIAGWSEARAQASIVTTGAARARMPQAVRFWPGSTAAIRSGASEGAKTICTPSRSSARSVSPAGLSSQRSSRPE